MLMGMLRIFCHPIEAHIYSLPPSNDIDQEQQVKPVYYRLTSHVLCSALTKLPDRASKAMSDKCRNNTKRNPHLTTMPTPNFPRHNNLQAFDVRYDSL
jgi:hypothetical protein